MFTVSLWTMLEDFDLLQITGSRRPTLRKIIRHACGEGILSYFCLEMLNQGEMQIFWPNTDIIYCCEVLGVVHQSGFKGIMVSFPRVSGTTSLPGTIFSCCVGKTNTIVKLRVIQLYSDRRLLVFPEKAYDYEHQPSHCLCCENQSSE
mmetsp:Transcript_3920/g.7540  ORF Transcript_3920/g.7540 Transcript_3920/m.7540 type:complete len:148 (-) Transcript_3920:130-573(-)